jgi:hypothetical protein
MSHDIEVYWQVSITNSESKISPHLHENEVPTHREHNSDDEPTNTLGTGTA